MNAPQRILLAAGGTGGHVFPAISIADAFRDQIPGVQIEFVGTRDKMEWFAVPKAGYKINPVWISGFVRRLTLQNVLFPVKLVTSIVQSFSVLNRFKPDVVVCCGGYAAGPIGWAASKKGIPVFLQEQNSFPGVTNRLLSEKAEAIYTAFREADDYFPKGKTTLYGNPTRKSLMKKAGEKAFDFFGFDAGRKTILVIGGSGGAFAINEAIRKNLDYLHNELGLQVLWQCGARYIEPLRKQIDLTKYPNLRLTDFIDRMAEAYEVADVVISRAGAGSCSELMLTGKPSILMPSPNVAGDHQTKNARAMAASGAALLIKDEEAVAQLPVALANLFRDSDLLKKMSEASLGMAKPDAAKHIAEDIVTRWKEIKK
jgi:UDP-N-acetylglucosamine--N-acetylmuramyl-(pentapeptide) pyrophosphoryl-undecaprenol N-acetylglucosamine transferase